MATSYTDIDNTTKSKVTDLLSKKEAIDISTEISDIYDIVNNTFVGKDKGEKHAELEVEIGDIHSDDFQTQFKIKRWDNECNFSVRLIDDAEDAPKIQINKNKIKFIKNNTEAHFYGVSKTEKMPEGYEFEIILKEKPFTNKVQMSIETKGLAFYYQPELTQKEKGEGVFRPENVVGSYAVYHENKAGDYHLIGGKNYRAGKAFHIYRPKIIDSVGTEVWGKLNIYVEKNLLTVEIPQEFLDNAVYPVKVDPTFGYTTYGASSVSNINDYITGSVFEGAAGTGSKISIGTKGWDSGEAIKSALYDANRNLLTDGTTEERTTGGADDFHDFNFTSAPTLTAQDYWVVCWGNDSVTIMGDSGNTNQLVYDSYTYGESWPSSINDGSYDYKLSLYCTYTAPTGGLSMAVAMHHLRQQGIS